MRRLFALLAVFPFAACDCGDGGGIRAIAPSIVANPNPIEMGEVYLGRLERQTLTISNQGEAPLNVTSIDVEDGSHPNLEVDNKAFTLAPGSSDTTEVRLRVTELGAVSGAILIASDDPNTPTLRVPLSAVGARRPGPAIEVCIESSDIPVAKTCADPYRVDVGSVQFGQTAITTVTITNRGTLPLEVVGVRFRAGSHPTFELDPTSLTTTLNTDESATVDVRFSPATMGEVNAVVEVESNDLNRDLIPIIFSAGGVAPALCPSLAAIDFGVVDIGQFADRTVTLESCGAVAINVNALEIAGGNPEFSVLNPPAQPITLAPGDTYDVNLRYQPADAGRDNERLRIGSDIADGFIELTGRTASCDLEVQPRAIDFGPVGSLRTGERSLLVSNIGAAECTITGFSLTPQTSSEFSIQTQLNLPMTIASGAMEAIRLEYDPADAGADMGALEITSTDQAEPTITVTLEGRRLRIGECQLSAQPDPIQFGLVPLGSTQTIGVQVTNTGASLCTVSLVNLDMASSLSFRVTTVLATPAVIPSGQSRTFDVEYTPRSATTESGTLQVFGLLPINPALTIPITGAGSGAKLCATPNPVVFGTRMVGAPVQRNVDLYACGTETVQITGTDFVAPTSSEYSFTNPPALPISIPAGTMTQLSLTYTGVDMGRDDGTLRLTSNDALDAIQDLQLIAASGTNCGDIQGKICGLGQNPGPVAGATVYVTTPGGRISATTNAAGDFVLTCIPPGTWNVTAEQGQWSTTFPALVNPSQVTSIPGQQCLDEDSAEIAVVWGEYDQIQDIITGLGVNVTVYGGMGNAPTGDLLLDANEMAQYDIIFLNCGMDEGVALTNNAIRNMRDFVSNGGSLYASDWAYDVVEVGWPNAIDFDDDDNVRNDAQDTGNFADVVNIVEPSLQMYLQRNTVQISSCCTGMDSVDSATTIYLEGDRRNDGGTHPFMVSFQPTMTSGRVFYTDFHNTGQMDINLIFQWLITQL